jgi:hypothetical protein
LRASPSAESEEKREPASDIDTPVMDRLKVLDPEWPIRQETDISDPISQCGASASFSQAPQSWAASIDSDVAIA